MLLFIFVALIRDSESVLCEFGEALKDPTNSMLDRSCGVGFPACPNNYVCTNPIGQTAVQSVCCPTKTSICAQPQQLGTFCGTSEPTERYYFDATLGSCVPFLYNGCFGDSNNFYTKRECERACLSNLCPRGIPKRTKSGIQRCQIGQSSCPRNFECVQTAGFLAGAICCPTSSIICSQPLRAGQACSENSQPVQRFHYDSSSKTCQSFQYLGCHGNDNHFATAQECSSYCSGIATQLCPPNSFPAPGTTSSTPCFQGTQCQQGYSCQRSPGHRQSYCCSNNGAPFFGMQTIPLCPNGSSPPPGTTTPCTTPLGCPVGYSCLESINGKSYCCGASSMDQICPTGSSPAPGVNVLAPCSQLIACPVGYSCQFSPSHRQSYCCSSGSPLAFSQPRLCPFGSTAAPDTNLDKPCDAMTICPTGYTCQSSGSNSLSYCCSAAQICPFGTTAAPDVTATTPCSQFTGCSPGYTCQYSPAQRQSYCCSDPNAAQLCPVGSQLAPFSQMCQSNSECPVGFTCQRTINGRSYCCSSLVSTVPLVPTAQLVPTPLQLCPIGAYPAPGITVTTPCYPSEPCPTGFTCQFSSNGQSYCCSEKAAPFTFSAPCPQGSTLAPGSAVCSSTAQCSPGYACQRSANGAGYCCSQQQMLINPSCPRGGNPQFYPGTEQHVGCAFDQQCQFPYFCQLNVGSSTGVCCSSSGSISDPDCPPGMASVHTNGQTIYCGTKSTPQPQLCPPLSQCVISLSRMVPLCCTSLKWSHNRNGAVTKNETYCSRNKDCTKRLAKCVQNICQCSNGTAVRTDDKCDDAQVKE